jgi:hypothetical protein
MFRPATCSSIRRARLLAVILAITLCPCGQALAFSSNANNANTILGKAIGNLPLVNFDTLLYNSGQWFLEPQPSSSHGAQIASFATASLGQFTYDSMLGQNYVGLEQDYYCRTPPVGCSTNATVIWEDGSGAINTGSQTISGTSGALTTGWSGIGSGGASTGFYITTAAVGCSTFAQNCTFTFISGEQY